jgi:DNA-binding transcriptional MerR regulator
MDNIESSFVYSKRLYSKRETAKLLSCTTRTIDNYVARRLLFPHRASRHVMFTPEQIEAFVQKFQIRPKA